MVPAGPVPEPGEEARAGGGHGPQPHPGGQLVQEPAAAGPRRRRQEPPRPPRLRLTHRQQLQPQLLAVHVARAGRRPRRRVAQTTPLSPFPFSYGLPSFSIRGCAFFHLFESEWLYEYKIR